MSVDFNPTYIENKRGDGFKVKHQTATVSKKSKEKALRGAVVEIQGTTTDGRRLCVAGEVSAWLPAEDLEEVKK